MNQLCRAKGIENFVWVKIRICTKILQNRNTGFSTQNYKRHSYLSVMDVG
jgi:hypothetical protein